MRYAKKLNIDFAWEGLRNDRRVVAQHGAFVGREKPGVTRRHISVKELAKFKELLPKEIRDNAIMASFSEISFLLPHIHTDHGCVINFYLATSGEITTFYEGACVYDDSYVTDNGNGYYNVDMNKIKPVEAYIAKPNDVWLLDVKQPHSVGVLSKDGYYGLDLAAVSEKARFMVQVYIDANYKKVAALLEGTE